MIESHYIKNIVFNEDTMFLLLKPRNYLTEAKEFVKDTNLSASSNNETINFDSSKVKEDINEVEPMNDKYVSNLLNDYNNNIYDL